MIAERWSELKDKFHAVLDLDAERRATYFNELRKQDAELCFELQSLLASHEEAGDSFLNEPLAQLGGLGEFANPYFTGRRIGHYEIVCLIGAGGMGEVYRAFRADDQYRKEVAIKVIRAGQASELILSRFKHERQILATLEHPGICRLLDGGTTDDGLPYYVMELIEGAPIEEYCRANRLSVTEQLKLFLKLCSALQYAHQRLVIHRDIKPANILVTKDGEPKLLDFGIAKLLDAGSENSSRTMVQLLTPGYASPEQINDEPVTTASDVYALGVVLYELLTGESPYGPAVLTLSGINQAIREREPRRPSAVLQVQRDDFPDGRKARLSRQLSGDLDTIVLMALRKEPHRRYPSVEQFAGDIERHLRKLPVLARRNTWGYLTSRFVVRHKAGVAAAAVTVIALISGLAISLHEARIAREQAQVAEQQRMRAEHRFNDVRKLANSLIFELHDSIKDLAGSTPARKLLVARAIEYLDSLSQESRTDASLQRELATGYERIGDVQGQPRQANLGDSEGAAASYRKAIAIEESLRASNPGAHLAQSALVATYGKLGDLLWAKGDLQGAIANSTRAYQIAEELHRAGPSDRADDVLFAVSSMDYGYKQAVIAGSPVAGIEKLRAAAAILERSVTQDPGDARAKRYLALSYSRQADILADTPQGRQQALQLYSKTIRTKQSLADSDPNNAEYRRLVAYDKFAMAELMSNMNQAANALRVAREALASFQQLAAADPANVQLQQDISRATEDIGQDLISLGRPIEAMQQFQASFSTLASLPDVPNPMTLNGFTAITDEFMLGQTHVLLARAATDGKTRAMHCTEAAAWLSKCRPAFESLREHASESYQGAQRVKEIDRLSASCSATHSVGSGAGR